VHGAPEAALTSMQDLCGTGSGGWRRQKPPGLIRTSVGGPGAPSRGSGKSVAQVNAAAYQLCARFASQSTHHNFCRLVQGRILYVSLAALDG